MIKKIGFGVIGIALLTSPFLVSAQTAQTVQLPSLPSGSVTVAQLQALIAELTQLLNSAASGGSATLTGTATPTPTPQPTASLTISAASTPASANVAPGTNNFVLANINLDTSQSSESIRLSSLPVVINNYSGGTSGTLAGYLTNCQLWNASAALNNQAIGGTSTNGWIVNGNLLEANFVFQNAITIPQGTVTTLSLRCNISSSIPSNSTFSAGVNSKYAPTPVGLQSGSSITPIVQTSSSGVMYVVSASLTATIPTPLPYSIVAGGTTNVTVGTFTLQPSGDNVQLQNIGLDLAAQSASSADVANASIWEGSTQIGQVVFTGTPSRNCPPNLTGSLGSCYFATTTIFASPNVNPGLPQNSQTNFTIKANISNIGTAQPGTSGDNIIISLADAQGVGVSSGRVVNSGPAAAPAGTGTRIFRSYPTIAQLSDTPSLTGSVGKQPILMRFSVTASASGPVGIALIGQSVSWTNVQFSSLQVYGFTDAGFSQPISGSAQGLMGSTAPTGSSGTTLLPISASPDKPIEIPAGQTYYFELIGNVSSVTGNASVTTTVSGATSYQSLMNLSNGTPNGFIWSPNDNGTSQYSTTDWTNGYAIPGLPAVGISQTVTVAASPQPGPQPSPASSSPCTLDGATVASGSSATFYSTSTVAYGNSCSTASQVRMCTNGALSGSASYDSPSCSVQPATPTSTTTCPSGYVLQNDSCVFSSKPESVKNLNLTFTASASEVFSGRSATLSVSVPSSPYFCAVSGGPYGSGEILTPPSWSGSTGALTKTTTFTVSCRGDFVQSLTPVSLTVTVVPAVSPLSSTASQSAQLASALTALQAALQQLLAQISQ